MVTTIRESGTTTPAGWEIGGRGPRGCAWDESVCTQSPSHAIDGRTPGDTQLYCARHCVLALQRLMWVHVATSCSNSLSDHLSGYREVGL